jgi:hypothetical protein
MTPSKLIAAGTLLALASAAGGGFAAEQKTPGTAQAPAAAQTAPADQTGHPAKAPAHKKQTKKKHEETKDNKS